MEPLRIASLTLSGVLCALLSSACSKDSAAPPDPPADAAQDWPAGTVLVVGGRPITAAEVEAWIPAVAMGQPTHSRPDHIRKALTNLTLPMVVGGLLVPEDRELARQRCLQDFERLQRGEELPLEAPEKVQRIHANWNSTEDIGLDRWGKAMELEPGEWHMMETVAGWTAMRLVKAPEDWLPNTPVTIEHVTHYYLDPMLAREVIGQALEQGEFEIQILDPEWRRYLPIYYQRAAERAFAPNGGDSTGR